MFLQRTLGGLQTLSFKKEAVVTEVARQLGCAYEEALPHVNEVMVSAHPKAKRKPEGA